MPPFFQKLTVYNASAFFSAPLPTTLSVFSLQTFLTRYPPSVLQLFQRNSSSTVFISTDFTTLLRYLISCILCIFGRYLRSYIINKAKTRSLFFVLLDICPTYTSSNTKQRNHQYTKHHICNKRSITLFNI